MSGFSVLVSQTARQAYYELDEGSRKRIKRGLDALGEDPYRPRSGADIKKLAGGFEPPFYRLRIGDYRVIYTMVGEEVKITEIVRRNQGYKWLE